MEKLKGNVIIRRESGFEFREATAKINGDIYKFVDDKIFNSLGDKIG